MKRINLYGLLIFSTALLIISGCNEETLSIATPSITPPPGTAPPPETAEPPISYAGEDFQILLPQDFCWLSGSYNETGNNKIENIFWKKISGPSSYIFESPNSLRTKVSKLEKGIYEFELTVTNTKGLTGKDITRITVGEMSQNKEEVILRDMAWVCPMGCYVEIENIYSYLPADSLYQVYIQRDNSSNWEEVIHESSQSPVSVLYTYTLYNGNLFIFHYSSSEQEDTPNIKIVY